MKKKIFCKLNKYENLDFPKINEIHSNFNKINNFDVIFKKIFCFFINLFKNLKKSFECNLSDLMTINEKNEQFFNEKTEDKDKEIKKVLFYFKIKGIKYFI